jgi:2,3-bisphosphoglycerate-independent phosphoglycerate mutase
VYGSGLDTDWTATWPGPVLFLFLDGVGLGADDPATNPLAAADLPALTGLCAGRPVLATALAAPAGPLRPLDACLGVPGLPQSGTGQVALLTGRNAAAHMGAHHGPYPPLALRRWLAEASLWTALIEAGRSVAYANAFPDRYLDRVRRGTARMGAIARAASLAGIPLRGPEELASGQAVSAFLTNEAWRSHLGYLDLPRIDEPAAGANLARLARGHDVTMFEFYASDIAGHRAALPEACAILASFDRFLAGVLAEWPDDGVLVLASDHGNVEDLTTARHTRNPALGVWRGPPARLASLLDVAPAVLAAAGVTLPGAVARTGPEPPAPERH